MLLVTGFIEADVDALARAVERLDEIDPHACRADAKARFDLPVMAAGYERVYRSVITHRADVKAKRFTRTA